VRIIYGDGRRRRICLLASAEATVKVQSRSDIVGGRTTEMGSKVLWMGGSRGAAKLSSGW
jgi:hypothetical protein